jgi:hypothetical protein
MTDYAMILYRAGTGKEWSDARWTLYGIKRHEMLQR